MPLTIDQLSPHVGSIFTARTAGGDVPLTLVEAVERPRHGLPARFATPLSLLLRAPEGVQLAQAAFEREHAALGKNVWMLVPVMGATPEQPDYEVILSELA
jgi:hypothetical protein